MHLKTKATLQVMLIVVMAMFFTHIYNLPKCIYVHTYVYMYICVYCIYMKLLIYVLNNYENIKNETVGSLCLLSFTGWYMLKLLVKCTVDKPLL